MRLAILLTCHNRRDTTLACLRALHACPLPPEWAFDVFLVDDGSTDGTGSAVRRAFPATIVIDGDGTLFWNGGMRMAFARAMEQDYPAYLWLNDDTLLAPAALLDLARCQAELAARTGGAPAIVVGATCDPVRGTLTYGGLVSDRRSPHRYELLPPSDQPQECQSLNGNCVLIPRAVVQAIGNIDPAFVHAIGDWDYGLRARRAGFALWVAPGFVGTCSANPPAECALTLQADLRRQWRRTCGPKGVPPRAWRVYVQRHCGVLWPLHFARPYVGTVLRALRAKGRLAFART